MAEKVKPNAQKEKELNHIPLFPRLAPKKSRGVSVAGD
jgi:hypothetical protein